MTDADGLVTARADELDVRDIYRHLNVDDAALLELLAGPGALRAGAGVFLREGHAVDHHATFQREDPDHATFLPAILARDHANVVVLLDVDTRHGYSTSGAREMIFMNRFSRSSRATGPKMRVPRGFFASVVRITTALSSKRM